MVRRIRLCCSCGNKRFIATSNRDQNCATCVATESQNEPQQSQSKKFHFYSDDEEEEDHQPMVALLKNSNIKDNSRESKPFDSLSALAPSPDNAKSDEEEETRYGSEADDDEDDVEILADFEQEEEAPTSDVKEFAAEFRQRQEELHAHVSGEAKPTTDNLDLSMCFVCGASLSHIKSGYKGRMNHIKRCSKKRGVSVKDVRADCEEEDFTDVAETMATKAKTPTGIHNPYKRKNEWHGDNKNPVVDTKQAKAPTSFDLLMAGARRVSKMEQIKQQRKKVRTKGFSTFRKYSSSSCPNYKKISGTDFVCDGFQYAGPETRNYFLTHFHSDHYGGITKNWTAGIIYCSLPTANLVHEQLGVSRDFLHPLALHEPTIIESRGKAVTVTLLDANHCPGAIMFLFEVGKRTILHVGDFRWNTELMSNQLSLKPFCRTPWTQGSSKRRLDDLFLDTTYCDPKYSLPSQAECIKAVVEVATDEIRRAQEQKKRILMLFGAYTIGKEAVYMAVAKHIGEKVYVDTRRFKVLSALQWPKEQMAMLTTKPEESMIWVVPLGHINMKKMPPYQSIRRRGFTRDFDRVIGFRPTGWSMPSSTKKKNAPIIGSSRSGSLTVHSVPYSEHSSFPELLDCLECLNPVRIIPTVSASSSQQQVELLTTYWRDKQAKLI